MRVTFTFGRIRDGVKEITHQHSYETNPNPAAQGSLPEGSQESSGAVGLGPDERTAQDRQP